MKRPQTYFIKTFGCQANQLDSQLIAGILEELGLAPAGNLDTADLVVINSCSVRDKAEAKVFGFKQKLLPLKSKPLVVLVGCLVGSAHGERRRFTPKSLEDKLSWVDHFLAPGQYHRLPEVLGFSSTSVAGEPKRPAGRCTSVTISTGCDNFCSYCVVPHSRGPERSRSKREILAEIKDLVNRGYTEFTLLGQNVNSWNLPKEKKFRLRAGGAGKLPFAFLLREVCALSGVDKVRFISSNPFDFTADLIEVLKHPKVSRYLHIAVQSGDDEILKRMNRRHTVGEFEELVAKIRQAVPEIRLGTDLIVGFPGETREQFANTVALYRKIRFANAYIASYSPRRGTAAAQLVDDVPLTEKKRRHQKLLKVVKENC